MKLLEIAPAPEPTGRYKVYLMGNWYNGKYFDYGGRPVVVPGNTGEEALQWLKDHWDEVVDYYWDRRFANKRRMLPSPADKNLYLDKSHADRPTENNLTPFGVVR